MKIRNRKIFKTFLLGLFVVNLFLTNTGTVYAQDATEPQGAQSSIANLLCTPTEPGDGQTGKSDIFKCINRAYQLIVVLGSIGAVFWIIVAGYLYMASDGNQESVTKAKEIMVSTVAGMFIILMTFVFLRQLNPDIVHFPAIDLQTITNSSGLLSPYDECILRNTQAGKTQAQAEEACKGLSHVVPGGGGTQPGQTITGTGGKVCSLGDNIVGVKAKCDIPQDWKNAIDQASQQAGINANFIKAVISKESTWDPKAVSYAGGFYGLMQVGDAAATDAQCTGNWKFDPITNIKCGTNYFKVLKTRYTNIQNTDDLLAAYNYGHTHLKPSNICTSPQLKEWQCPFTNQSQTACYTDGRKQPKQVQDYVVTINRVIKDYQRCGG